VLLIFYKSLVFKQPLIFNIEMRGCSFYFNVNLVNLQPSLNSMEKGQHRFSFLGRIKSFGHAFRGIYRFFKTEHNARIHLVATIVVVFFGRWLSISRLEWVMVFFAIGFVFSAEVFNTAIEKMADEITSDHKESIKNIKDLSAAAVLVAAITAAIIGLIIFVPPILDKITC